MPYDVGDVVTDISMRLTHYNAFVSFSMANNFFSMKKFDPRFFFRHLDSSAQVLAQKFFAALSSLRCPQALESSRW